MAVAQGCLHSPTTESKQCVPSGRLFPPTNQSFGRSYYTMPQVQRIATGKVAPRSTKPQLNGAASTAPKLSLPTEVNTPPSSLSDYCICLYGAKGIGKTSLAAQNEGYLTLMTEPRRRNLSILQVPKENEPALDWNAIKGYIELGIDSPDILGFNVDSVDRAYDLCFAQVCKDVGCNHPNEMNDYGATWNRIKAEFETTFNTILFAGKGLWFISHAHQKENDEVVATEKFETCMPTCSPACWKYLKAVCDFAFYYGYTNRNRSIVVRGEGFIWTGCGVEDRFLDPQGEPLKSFYVSNNPQAAHADLLAAFDNQLQDCSWTPPLEETAVKRTAPKKRRPV